MKWSRILLLLLFLGCDDRVEEPNKSNVIVTMLRVERIEILDNIWVTPAPIWGHLESEEADVERLVCLLYTSDAADE